MKLIDLLLLAALISLCIAVAAWSPVAAFLVFAAGSVALWYFLDEA